MNNSRLNNSRPPSLSVLNNHSPRDDGNSHGIVSNLSASRNIPTNSSFKEQKRNYNLRKKYFTRNIQGAIESSEEVHSGWLKARTTFKRWTKIWCQIKLGYLIIYTSQEAQKKHRLGVVILSVCQAIRRPTKKDGFCFKLINPFGCSVWAKSSTRALAFAQASLTLRASDPPIGRLWLDALHRCNLSANLNGFQPVIDEEQESNLRTQCNRSDISYSDDGHSRLLENVVIDKYDSASNSSSSSLLNSCQTQLESSAGVGSSPHSKLLGSNIRDNYVRSGFDENENNLLEQHKDKPSSQVGKEIYDIRTIGTAITRGDAWQVIKSDRDGPTQGLEGLNDISGSYSGAAAPSKYYSWRQLNLEGVSYVGDGMEELGVAGVQSEEVHDSNKNFLWHIIKQLRPGMDLSKVTLPTFILEPRSFLEKLADYYYHCDILSDAVMIEDPELRLINIVKWYLSGFYKKPKGPKKPYNPILGERFRCFWDHPRTQSRTFFVAEQVSHHPPISAFHVSNRKDGYTITCALLSRSKFGGNSVSAILDGRAKLHLTKRGEVYTLTMPYANCRGILLGSLCLELGGKVEIECIETGCKCELDFKLAPVWASASSYNALTGKILRANKITHTLEGHWDKKINITDKRTNEKSVLWEVTDAVRNSRLKRYTVAMKDQSDRESVKLWHKVTEALLVADQTLATAEKTRLEEMQRQEARDRLGPFAPKHFGRETESNDWSYRWKDNRPWNSQRDIMQFEDDFRIRTLVSGDQQHSNNTSTNSKFDSTIDLPISKLGKLLEQIRENSDTQVEGRNSSNLADQINRLSSPSSTDLTCAVDNMVEIKQAIKQVAEKSKKLEEDLATLKRSKKTVAFIFAALIVALLGVFVKYFS